MLIKYYKHVYKCELVKLGGVEFYKGKILYKNGNSGKRNHYFVPGKSYYSIIEN